MSQAAMPNPQSEVEILVPAGGEKGIGEVVITPDSRGLIAGVRIQPLTVFTDDRGYFLEIFRMGQGLVAGYPAASTQVSASWMYPGAIKAFHYHKRQTDAWAVVAGMLQAALVDLRSGSPTQGRRNTIFLGELRPWQILIPPGVAHGCKAVGPRPALLVYATDRFYDPSDEGRLPYNHPGINYDWETQRK
jgi:dTDP-4-dehydrorhamnose 3,5-epimerase